MDSRLCCGFTFAILCIGLVVVDQVLTEVSWTPIYVDTSNRKDLWTIKPSGCACPNGGGLNCACCVKPGGCLCSWSPNKCSQCGLEDSCQRFCNVTISSRVVALRSGLSWVHLKSPELEGPTSCWWRLQSAPGQRIEVQIHRLMSVGVFDNSTQKCTDGFLQFADGDTSVATSQAIQLCAQNSRFSPPVVLFGDQGTATLLLKLTSTTSRSQLLAYVSFSSADDPVVGSINHRGGSPHSVCDWTFDNCWQLDCIVASPGFPGLFPPHRRCRYYFTANSTTDKILLKFHSLSFPPPPLCSTHHIAIWKRNLSDLSNLGTPWKTLCQESESTVQVDGGQVLVEFRSASTSYPYLYNGFRASAKFIRSSYPGISLPPLPALIPGASQPQVPSVTITSRPTYMIESTTPFHRTVSHEEIENTEEPLSYPRAPYESGVYPIHCGHIFEGAITRGTVFRLNIPSDLTHPTQRVGLRGFGSYNLSPQAKLPSPGPFKCVLEFRGKSSDVVQMAIFNYKFRGRNCSTVMEVYDMDDSINGDTGQSFQNASFHQHYEDRLLGKMCGPSGNEMKRFTSSHNKMALVAIVFPYDDPLGAEFLEGAFRFHDESVEGTVKPMSNCEVVYYGVTSLSTGSLSGPPDSPLLRLSTFPLLCAYSFLPSWNQSISLTLIRAGHDMSAVALGSKKYCRTICSTSGCSCQAKYTTLDQIDNLLLVAGSIPIACLCGFISKDALPMTFESQLPLTLVYHATKGGREFSYSASFHFRTKVACTNYTIMPPSASKRWREMLGSDVVSMSYRNSQHYTYFHCVWPISIPDRYKLTVDFVSEENEKDCNTWNLTLWAGNERTDENAELLSSFCPRNGRKEIKLPESVHNAFVKLVGVTLRPPQFEVRWRYHDVVLGSGLFIEKKISGAASLHLWSHFIPLVLLFYCIQKYLTSPYHFHWLSQSEHIIHSL